MREEPPTAALRHIKPAVRALGAYTLRPDHPPIKLNQNESPYDVPLALKQRIAQQVLDRPWNRYPPFVPHNFLSAVADATGWPRDGILVANGSNELIQAILATVVGPGVRVTIPEPTFTLYRLMTGVSGGEVVSVPLDDELRFDVPAIIHAARSPEAAAIVLCTPNNPTGAALERAQIERIHDETDALIVLDQAYVEFGGFDAIPLLPGRPRLLLLRTFSKALAAAGLRAGYLLADPAIATEIAKAKLPYNVNFFTECAAAEILRNRELLAPQIECIRHERDRLHAALAALPGIRIFSSAANFLLFRVELPNGDHRELFERLRAEHGVLVRDVSNYPMLERCLRVNAGTPAENDAFLTGLRALLEEKG